MAKGGLIKSKEKFVSVHGWEGRGKSTAEAKQNAIALIEAAAQGDWSPLVCRYRDMVGIVWREPTGYCYTIIRRDFQGSATSYCTITFQGDRWAVWDSMLSHLAQNGFVPGESPEPPDILMDPKGQDEFRRWAKWQNALKAHLDANPDATNTECRRAADIALNGYSLE